MSSSSVRRIAKEIGDIQKTPIEAISVKANEDDLMHWAVEMIGPSGTPYKGGKFKLSITFGNDFPFKPPTCKFVTKVYHPNVDDEGNICLGILKTENWKPATRVSGILTGVYDLFSNPNPDDPLVASIADTYMTNPKQFEKEAKEATAKYAV